MSRNWIALATASMSLCAAAGTAHAAKGGGNGKPTSGLANVFQQLAADSTLGPADAERAMHKGLNAVNVKLARAAAPGSTDPGDPTLDGFGLYGILHVPNGTAPQQASLLSLARGDDAYDVFFEISADAAARRTAVVLPVAYDPATFPEFGGMPIELQFAWPAVSLPDTGSLTVQVRVPLGALAEQADLSSRAWDPALLGASFPDPTLDFDVSGDDATLADQAGLDAGTFTGWVDGSNLSLDELVATIAKGAQVDPADAAALVDAWSSPVAVDGPSKSPAGMGTFTVAKRSARPGRNPQTGKAIKLAAKKVVKFKAGAELAKTVNFNAPPSGARMKKGVVKFFNEAKGFGIIVEDGTNREIFVHASGLADKIRENDTVTFEVQEGKKGLNAVNVKLA